MTILASGPVETEEQVDALARTTSKAIVSMDEKITHYWLLEFNGRKVVYFGTLESFDIWKAEDLNG